MRRRCSAAPACCRRSRRRRAAPQAERRPVIFRVEVDYVEVDAFVTDAQGNPVNDLTADDFEVLEDGKPQKVTSFSLVNIPIERAERPLFAGQPIEPDVQTNDHVEGRIYLIVLDDLHTDFTRTPRVKAAARRFIEQNFGTNDLAAVVFTGRSDGSQDFTNNPRLLLAAIDKFIGPQAAVGHDRADRGRRASTRRPATLRAGRRHGQMERAFRARNAMGTIRKLAEFMAGVRGRRKAMLLVGEGVDYDIHEAVGLAGLHGVGGAARHARRDRLRHARQRQHLRHRSARAGDRRRGPDHPEPARSRSRAPACSRCRASCACRRTACACSPPTPAASPRSIATTSTPPSTASCQENSSYYLLGYYSTNERRDGRFRKIEVRVKRPGLRVVRVAQRLLRGARPPAGRRRRRRRRASPALAGGARQPAAGGRRADEGVRRRLQGRGAQRRGGRGRSSSTRRSSTSSRRTARSTSSSRSSTPPPTPTGKVFPGERHSANLTLKPDTYAAREGARLPRGDAGEPAARAAISCASPPATRPARRAACSTTSTCRTSTRRRSR